MDGGVEAIINVDEHQALQTRGDGKGRGGFPV